MDSTIIFVYSPSITLLSSTVMQLSLSNFEYLLSHSSTRNVAIIRLSEKDIAKVYFLRESSWYSCSSHTSQANKIVLKNGGAGTEEIGYD